MGDGATAPAEAPVSVASWVFVVNPASAGGQTKRRWDSSMEKFRNLAKKRGINGADSTTHTLPRLPTHARTHPQTPIPRRTFTKAGKSAGSTRSSPNVLPLIRACCRRAGVRVAWTERPGHAVDLTREALRGGAGVVVCVGGDGTLAEVVEGFFVEDQKREMISGEAALGFVPAGTGGDFRRSAWDSKFSHENALARLLDGARTRLDVGYAILSSSEGGGRKASAPPAPRAPRRPAARRASGPEHA